MSTILEVVKWMIAELKREKYLRHEQAVYGIETKFGKGFTYLNKYGNLAIDRNVLREFRWATENTVVWERKEILWRIREGHDPPGRDADSY